MTKKIVCFGELLLRLGAPSSERLLQSPSLNVAVGGAEANVAVNLARFGHAVQIASVVPDNDLGSAAIGEVRKHGVDVSHIVTAPGRVGLYFLSQGAVSRPSQIIYDRGDSAFACHVTEALDADICLQQADWLHLSGVTPAIGALGAQASITWAETAIKRGVKLAFDGNYRGQLWAKWQGDGPAILKSILSCATLAFINERDLELIFDRSFKDRQAAYDFAFSALPKLEWIAATTRSLSSVSNQTLQGELVSRSGRWVSGTYDLIGVVDRIGAGDAFAAGVLHGLSSGHNPQACVDFATACGVIKHSILGDFNLTTLNEVQALANGDGLDIKR
jgi:2-dehydro-3-deoxygluconokinase